MEKIETFRTTEGRVFDEEEPAKLCEEIEREARYIIKKMNEIGHRIVNSRYHGVLQETCRCIFQEIKDSIEEV